MAGAEIRRAQSLDEVRTFLLEECNYEPIFYSSEISLRRSDSCRTVTFDCVLERRRRELVDAGLILEIASVEVLVGVVKALVSCSTWTHAKFQFGCSGFGYRDSWSDRDDTIALVTSVAAMSARSETLKHVLMSFEWGRDVNDLMCSCRKQVELSTQKRLREIMVGNELRGSTSLETLEVGYWKLIRHVGGGPDEWHMSYGGPCQRLPSNEYVVKVQM